MIALFSRGPNLAATAILLDRTISLFSVMVIGFVVFIIAFGRQAAKQPESSGASKKDMVG